LNPEPARPLLYLIDASSYVFRAFHAIPPLSTAKGIPTNAVFGMVTMLQKLLREAVPEYAIAVFDAPGPTFRDQLFRDYKANRPPAPAELDAQAPFIRRVVPALGFPVREERGVEADDVIGTLAQRAVTGGCSVVVVTGDKDMRQIVGPHVALWDTMRDRWTRLADIRERFGLEPAQLVDVMALMGDPTDNVPGVAGIGEKTATALIKHFGSLDAVLADPGRAADAGIRGAARVVAALERDATAARASRELVRIRCDLDLDFSLASCRFRGIDPSALRPLLAELEFFSLLREIGGDRAAAVMASPPTVADPEDVQRVVRRALETGRLGIAATWSSSRSTEAELQECGVAADPHESEGGAVGVGTGGGTVEALRCLAPALESSRVEKIGDGLKTLMVAAGRRGVPVAGPLFDTAVASYLIDPSREGHGVDLLVERLLGEGPPAGPAARAGAALRLRQVLEEHLAERDALPLLREVEMPLVSVLARMEAHGVLVDAESLGRLSAEYAVRREALIGEIHALAGGPFNLHSPVQLRAVLFERLGLPTRGIRKGKTGLSTDVDVLTRLAALHPLPAKILEYRGLAKLKSTYVDALPELVDPRTGRIHTSFHQTVTATGRLSSSDPNLQNIPIRGEEGRRIRAAFRAPPGRLLLAADYSQIELRILAHLSGDATLTDAFRRGEDVHARTAAEVFGGLAAMSEDARRVAKMINFGILYGMGPGRLARELDIPQPEAASYIRRYFERYAGVRAFLDATVALARERGYVVTLLNRRRYLPELSAEEGAARQFAERTAVNTPIQGSAADVIKMAMVSLDSRIRREGFDVPMVLQVHDELVFEVPAEQLAGVQDIVRAEMEGVVQLDVPLRVDIRAGANWAEAH
jgi:DNA polymerase-1